MAKTKRKLTEQDLIRILYDVERDPAQKQAFNRAIQREADKEAKRPGGEFSAMFMRAIRIP